MKPGQMLSNIFKREIARLHDLSQQNPLDISDLVKLEKLVSSYRKFIPTDPDEPDTLDSLSTDALMSQLNADPTRAPTAEEAEVRAVEEGGDQLATGQDTVGDEG